MIILELNTKNENGKNKIKSEKNLITLGENSFNDNNTIIT